MMAKLSKVQGQSSFNSFNFIIKKQFDDIDVQI